MSLLLLLLLLLQLLLLSLLQVGISLGSPDADEIPDNIVVFFQGRAGPPERVAAVVGGGGDVGAVLDQIAQDLRVAGSDRLVDGLEVVTGS